MNSRATHVLASLFCAGIFLFTGLEVLHFAREAHPWAVGDWAINYSQGFIRRGLAGELARQISAWSRLPWIGIIAAIQILSYGSILYCAYLLLKRSPWNRWILFLVSPATLLFPVYAYDGGYRKEILLYAFLLALSAVVLLGRASACHDTLLLCSVSVLSFALVLAHEGLFLYLPYYVALAFVLARDKPIPYRYAFALGPVLGGLIAFVLSIRSPGNAAMADGICKSLGPAAQTTDVCKGAIMILAASVHEKHETVLWYMRAMSYVNTYVTTAILAALPFASYVLGRRDRWRDRRFLLSIVVLPTVGVVTSLPLFFVAIDWGRFIHVHAMSIFIVILAYEAAVRKDSAQPTWTPAPRQWRAGLLVVVAVVYMTTWTLPHCCDMDFGTRIGAVGTRARSHWLELLGPLSSVGCRLDC